ncbi:hypothetical protein LEP1GSC133_3370 [Leptospira borgpetersenii serovar Pomona str. 200901868]|uniref:Uncharacterized protein n=1 Tax=Leptospira borgpetersenii serovar Pomona str. 200901868 TaxID=1192866 RepID=M6VWW9_LEPBO|nr:hypothetical protein LEP1GSC133_3370 [Leptospira borgpetersenii serovar Pomona str. 200901868]
MSHHRVSAKPTSQFFILRRIFYDFFIEKKKQTEKIKKIMIIEYISFLLIWNPMIVTGGKF